MVDTKTMVYLSHHFFVVYPVGAILETAVHLPTQGFSTVVQVGSNGPICQCFVAAHVPPSLECPQGSCKWSGEIHGSASFRN